MVARIAERTVLARPHGRHRARSTATTTRAIAKELGKHYLPALRSLFLGDFHGEETELNWSDIGKLEPMYAAMPNLEKLKLRSGAMKLGAIVLPHLKHFEVDHRRHGCEGRRASIAAAVWPSLEKLSIQIGPEPDGGDVKVKDLAADPRRRQSAAPHRISASTNFNLTGQLVEPLATSKILPQLAELDLSMGTLGDEQHRRRCSRCRRRSRTSTKLDVNDNYITNEGKSLLKQAKLAFNFGEQREDEGDPSRSLRLGVRMNDTCRRSVQRTCRRTGSLDVIRGHASCCIGRTTLRTHVCRASALVWSAQAFAQPAPRSTR